MITSSPYYLGTSIEISNIVLNNNTGTLSGGGLYLTSDAIVSLLNITSNSNTAGLNGGGLCMFGSESSNINYNTFYNNSALGNGGGIYAKNSQISLDSNYMYGNKANLGGGIYLSSLDVYGRYGNPFDTKINNSQFINNVATTRGGAVALNSTCYMYALNTSGNEAANGQDFSVEDGTTIADMQVSTFYLYSTNSTLESYGQQSVNCPTGYYSAHPDYTDLSVSIYLYTCKYGTAPPSPLIEILSIILGIIGGTILFFVLLYLIGNWRRIWAKWKKYRKRLKPVKDIVLSQIIIGNETRRC